jgi:hypothetical protein
MIIGKRQKCPKTRLLSTSLCANVDETSALD